MDDIFDAILNTYQSDLKIYPKSVWGHNTAQPHKEAHPDTPLETPVTFVYCSFNTSSPGGTQRDFVKELGPRPGSLQVLDSLKSIQVLDYRKKWHNIRYNFMIGGDGVVYQGRGWRVRPSLPSKHIHNWNRSLYIGFIGYWHDEPPDDKLFKLRDDLIRIGIEKEVIQKKCLIVTLAFPCVYKFDFNTYIK